MEKHYYRVTLYTDMWECEISAEDVARIRKGCEAEHTGYTRDVHEVIMVVEDDPEKDEWDDEQIKQYLYRVGNTWTSIPAAFESMQLNLVDEDWEDW